MLTSSWAAAFGHCMESMPQVDFLVLEQRQQSGSVLANLPSFPWFNPEYNWIFLTANKVISMLIVWITPNLASHTSRDPSSALTCWTCHTVPSCKLHIRKLGDIPSLPIVSLLVLQMRGQVFATLILACLLVEVGKSLPHAVVTPERTQSSQSFSLRAIYLKISEFNGWKMGTKLSTTLNKIQSVCYTIKYNNSTMIMIYGYKTQ